jgi:fructose-1,6-bisphosphatase I
MYECNPFAFIYEKAGGIAMGEDERILEIIPGDIHQRSPFYIGDSEMIRELLGESIVQD